MFGKLFLLLFFLLILADIYIYNFFIKRKTQNRFLRILWFIPSAFLLIGVISFYISGIKSDKVDVVLIVYISIILPKLFFSLISLFDIPFRHFFRWKIYPFTILGLIAAIGIEFIILYGTLVGKTKLVVKEIEFVSSNIPESFDGYRIVQISDLHLGNWSNGQPTMKNLVKTINEQNADVVFVTGDVVNHFSTELEGYEDILSGIKAKDGVYSVLGNHDYAIYHFRDDMEKQHENALDLTKRQEEMGWRVLNNENEFIVRDNDSIAIIGVENEGKPPFPDFGDLIKAMKGTENTRFKILLSHDPSHWRREVLDTDIDLMLSGHTHGAQFSLGNYSLSSYMYPEWNGLYMENGQGIYVNVGIGFVGMPFRFGVWPEITVITLKKNN